MPVVDDEVPQWKKELIQKKQMWKRSGGWSVPPVAAPHSASKTGLKVRPPEFKKMDQDRSVTPVLDRVDSNNNGTTSNLLAASAENVFGSVSELRTFFQPDDVFTPLTKARSVENILDGPVVLDSRRRGSTSTQFSGFFQKTALKKNVNAVPKMEDFFKKYRKNTRKTVVVESEVDSPRRPVVEKPRRKRIETVYFVDMNHDELPLPNTVRQAVKVFEEPVKTERNSTKPDFDEITTSTERPEAPPRARDVVQKFEARIKSSAPQKPPRPTRQNGAGQDESFGPPNGHDSFARRNGPSKPAILSPASDSHSRKEYKHVSFVENGPLNLVVQNDGPTNLDSIRDDLKTVTINTNKSIIIKTV